MSKGIEECEGTEEIRSMGGEEGGEGPKVTRGLRMTELVIGGRDWTARGESRPIGVARWDRHRPDRAVLEKRSQPEKPAKGHQSFRRARGCKRVMEDDEILDVQGGDRNYGGLREGAIAVEPTPNATGETVRERSKREWLRKWRLVQEGVG